VFGWTLTMKRSLYLILSPLLLMTALAQSPGRPSENNNGVRYQQNRVLVRFRGPAQPLQGSGQSRQLSRERNLYLINNPPGLSVGDAIKRYKGNPNVIYVEPDYDVHLLSDTTPPDPRWSEQWDMVKIGAPAAWTTQTNAADVVVAVVDTGISFSHPDLQANLWTDASSGTHGFNCIGGTCVPGGDDDHGHGTHVSGTIGAAANNGEGIAGINWTVQLMAIKILNSGGGGSLSDAVAGYAKIADLRRNGVNIRVTNNSWAADFFSQSLKDAMADAESAGILNVCAAGNYVGNTDLMPIYPAGYDNRGIVSVAASDSSDNGPSFTNYGLVSVDIAAPGVDVLSTIPGGYSYMSGTSMAAPHVTGVAAALFHLNPGASPERVRDVILSPSSYTPMSDARLQMTSTGGRLNFARAIANPLLQSGQLNNFPLVSVSDVVANGFSTVSVYAAASDADGDPIAIGWTPLTNGPQIYGAMLPYIFPNAPLNVNPFTFTPPGLGLTALGTYAVSISDRRGGGASAQSMVQILSHPNHGSPPTGNLTLSSTNIAPGGTVTLSFPTMDPENQSPVYWEMWYTAGELRNEFCCFTGDVNNYNFRLLDPGIYRVSAQAIDRQLNLSPRYTDIVRVGGATGTPPIASASVDKTSGAAPLTVTIDMRASTASGGVISTYEFDCDDGAKSSSNPVNSCTYTHPGAFALWTHVTDNNDLTDASKTYITVLPPASSDTASPAVSITSPTNGATVSGTVTVSGQATDNVGVSSVSMTAGAIAIPCALSGSAYSCTWNSGSSANGNYTITVTAKDAANNRGSSSVDVTLNNPDTTAPAVTINSPANGATISGTVTVTGTATDNVGVSSVTMSTGGPSTACTVTGTNYSCTWNAGSLSDGSYTITVTAKDAANNSGASSISVTVSNADTTPPTVSIAVPTNGATVAGTVTVTGTATDNVGVNSVTMSAGGSSTGCTVTGTNYSCTWNAGSLANGSYTITVTAKDEANNSAASSVNVTLNNPDTTAPAVTVSSPATGATVSGTVIVIGTATDNVGVSAVTLSTGGPSTACTLTGTNYSCSWSAGSLANGSYALTVTAKDDANNSGSNSVTVTLSNPDTTAPAVMINSPASGTTVSGTVTVSGTATDNVGVSAVTMSTGGPSTPCALAGANYSCTWNTGSTPNGSYTITVTAKDAANNSASSSVNVTLDNDTTPPVVTISSPGNGAMVSGTVTITGTAVDNVGVSSVAMATGGPSTPCALAGTNYSCTWSTGSSANGNYTITVTAKDAANNTSSSSVSVALNNDTTPPNVNIGAPANGAVVVGTVTVTATASDNVGVTSVAFYDGDALICTVTGLPFSCLWNSAATSNDVHTISVLAKDAANNSSTSSVIVTVDNASPTTTFITPRNGDTIVTGQYTVQINASDNFTLSLIELFIDGTPVASSSVSSTTGTLSYKWSTAKLRGNYSLTARSTDAAGNVSTSTVSVTVK